MLQSGQTLLHYRVVEKIGEGGMGVVWKALDTTLDREVAIKALPEGFSADAERLSRFKQEARLLAALNHPGIASVYSVHEAGDLKFLAMELVHGEDLAQRLSRGPLPLDEALQVALQVAEALEVSHDSGVIHRDLKPANIQLTPAGKVKVLDFGLAKALAPDTRSGDPSLSPTMTSAGTLAGMILGTASYMSPEQARGREVDRRADVWAFGCVLYEMLTGRRAFEGETISDTLASVLKVDPDWDALPAQTPPAVRRLLRRCLSRDIERRLSHVSGARLDLRDVLEGTAETVEPQAAAQPAPRRNLLPWALVGLLTVLAAALAWSALGGRAPDREPLNLFAPFPKGLTLPGDQMGVMALAPDGKTLAVVLANEAENNLYLRRLDRSGLVLLPDTHGATTPFFSPDGKWVAFFAEDRLKKVSVDGGNPVTLCEANGSNRGASWGAGDRIVFSQHYTGGLMWVPGGGGTPAPLTTLDTANGERTHRWPFADPERDLVLFTVGTMDSPEDYDGSRIDAVRLSSGERTTVIEGASAAWYLDTGHLVFAREGFLFAVPFDPGRLQVRGTPVPVVENVAGIRSSGVVYAGFSRNGLLSYISGDARKRQQELIWRYTNGRVERLDAPVAGYQAPRLSPDGKQIAIGIEGDSTFDIWTYQLERRTVTRLTFEGDNTHPVWSPDGSRVAFASVRNNALMSTYVKAADGSGAAQMLYSPERHTNAGQCVPSSWSSDGKHLLLEFTDENANNILDLALEDDAARIVADSPAAEQTPAISPDGHWIAYASDETGRFEIYVRPFDGAGGKRQISTGGGLHPAWSTDGATLFFRWNRELLSVRIDLQDDKLFTGRPQTVLDDLDTMTADRDYDTRGDGRFLVIKDAAKEKAPEGITVVVNWLDELRRRVPG